MDCSFSNLSVTSPTSQLIFRPFRCFTYVTAHSPTLLSLLLRPGFSLTSPGEPPMDHGFQVLSAMLKYCPMQLYVGLYHVVSAEICVAMAVPIENPADSEVRGDLRFLQADEILDYLAEEASSHVELFRCTTMHVRILPERHKPCCVSYSFRTPSSILRTVLTWHRRTFSCFQQWSTLLTNASQMMKT